MLTAIEVRTTCFAGVSMTGQPAVSSPSLLVRRSQDSPAKLSCRVEGVGPPLSGSSFALLRCIERGLFFLLLSGWLGFATWFFVRSIPIYLSLTPHVFVLSRSFRSVFTIPSVTRAMLLVTLYKKLSNEQLAQEPSSEKKKVSAEYHDVLALAGAGFDENPLISKSPTGDVYFSVV